MKDELISFETAKLAKEKGWDGDFVESHKILTTQSLLAKWLREEHNIHTWVIPYTKDGRFDINPLSVPDGYRCNIYPFAKSMVYDTYKEALEVGLQGALKLIK